MEWDVADGMGGFSVYGCGQSIQDVVNPLRFLVTWVSEKGYLILLTKTFMVEMS